MAQDEEPGRKRPRLDEVPDGDASEYKLWDADKVLKFFSWGMGNKYTKETIETVLLEMIKSKTMYI